MDHQEWKRFKRDATLREMCPAKSCGAHRGYPCTNRSGHPVPYFHVGRTDKAMRRMGKLQEDGGGVLVATRRTRPAAR